MGHICSSTVRTDDVLKVRFSATVGEESEVELVWLLRSRALLTELPGQTCSRKFEPFKTLFIGADTPADSSPRQFGRQPQVQTGQAPSHPLRSPGRHRPRTDTPIVGPLLAERQYRDTNRQTEGRYEWLECHPLA
jgi:hypothetical protein